MFTILQIIDTFRFNSLLINSRWLQKTINTYGCKNRTHNIYKGKCYNIVTNEVAQQNDENCPIVEEICD